MKDNNSIDLIITVIITVAATIIIVALAFLFYYYAIKSSSIAKTELTSDAIVNSIASASSSTPDTSNFTKIISFKAPDTLPETVEVGKCWTNSISQPYREDAFRCMIESSIYDPCFTTNKEGFVFCQMNPLKEDSFLIKLTESLPKLEIPAEKQDNWAWFIKLKDGTYCSPFTGTRMFVGEDIAYYGCNSATKGETVVLIGDLKAGDIWTADKATLVKSGQTWTTKSLENVEIDSVWQ